MLLIRTSGDLFNEIITEIYTFSFRKTHLKMSSDKWQPFCLGLNVLNYSSLVSQCDDYVNSPLSNQAMYTCLSAYFLCYASGQYNVTAVNTGQGFRQGLSVTMKQLVLPHTYIWSPVYWHGLTLIPAWTSNDIYIEVWEEITLQNMPMVSFGFVCCGYLSFYNRVLG